MELLLLAVMALGGFALYRTRISALPRPVVSDDSDEFVEPIVVGLGPVSVDIGPAVEAAEEFFADPGAYLGPVVSFALGRDESTATMAEVLAALAALEDPALVEVQEWARRVVDVPLPELEPQPPPAEREIGPVLPADYEVVIGLVGAVVTDVAAPLVVAEPTPTPEDSEAERRLALAEAAREAFDFPDWRWGRW